MDQYTTEIHVTGRAEIEIEADLCTVMLEFSCGGRSRSSLMRQINADVRACKRLISDFDHSLRASDHSYSVQEHWDSGPEHLEAQIHVAEKTIQIEMPADEAKVLEFTDRLSALNKAPGVKLEYRVTDTSVARVQVRKDAIKSATHAAQEIADALDLRLSNISAVSYELPQGLARKAESQALGFPVIGVSSRADKVIIEDRISIVFNAEKHQ
jgi:uncharacterized protein YggE